MSPSPADDQTALPDDLPEDPQVSYIPDKTMENRPIRSGEDDILATMSFNKVSVAAAPDGGGRTTAADTMKAGGGAAAYSLRRLIGEGGFGEVWEARQNSLTRTIAIKRLREDLLESSSSDAKRSQAFRQSFCEEALTAAHLDHPNIVPVYDLGMDDQGRPLLAMKLVKGTPWNKMLEADFQNLAPDDLIAKHISVLMDVAQAVAFAHSRGIAHRDLKPAQVIVRDYGETLLMDWGLAVVFNAEALKQHDESASLDVAPTPQTASNPAGTPAFMAPEQTESTAKNIGPWTDVYLLGGILYYMLTGRAPRKGGNTAQLFMQAAQGVYTPIKEAAPGRPMPEELVVLCEDALSPRIVDRVPSAQGFVYRIQQYLSGANNREESFKITVEVKKRLKDARGDYRVYGDCVALLNRALTLWPGNPDGQALQEQALTEFCRAAVKHGDFTLAKVQADRKEDEAEAKVLHKEIKKAEFKAGRAKRIRKLLLFVIFVLILAMGAGAAYFAYEQKQQNELIEQARLQAERQRSEAESQSHRASAARAQAEDLIDFMLRDLARQLEPVGRLDVLDEVAQRSMSYFASLPATDKTIESQLRETLAMRQIGAIMEARGDLAAAETHYSSARNRLLTLRNQAPRDARIVESLGDSYRLLGRLQLQRGNNQEALRQFSEFRDTMRALLDDDPNNPLLEHQYAMSLLSVAQVERNLLRFDAAMGNLRSALDTVQRLADATPMQRDWQRDLGRIHNSIGSIQQQRGDLAGAERSFATAEDLLSAIVAADPVNKTYREELARSLLTLADLSEARGDLPGAISRYQDFHAAMSELAELDPANTEWEQALAEGRRRKASPLVAQGEFAKARELVADSVLRLDALVALDGTNASWRRERIRANALAIDMLMFEEQHEEARRQQLRVDNELRTLLFGDRNRPARGVRDELVGEYALNRIRMAETLYALQNFTEAEAMMAEARNQARPIFQADPSNTVARRTLGRAFLLNAKTRESFGEVDGARRAREEAVEVLQPLAAEGARWTDLLLLSRAYVALGRSEEARPHLQRLAEQGVELPGLAELRAAAGF